MEAVRKAHAKALKGMWREKERMENGSLQGWKDGQGLDQLRALCVARRILEFILNIVGHNGKG